MKVKFTFGMQQAGTVTFYSGVNDPKFYGTVHAKGENALFYFLKKWLNEHGFNLVKKSAQADGHMVGDQYQPYLRTSIDWPRNDIPHICIMSGFYALRGANEDWNKGSVTLDFHGDYFGKEQDTFALIRALAKQHKEISCARN
jgi:hypothetical protein